MRRGRRSGTWRHAVAALGASALLLASAAPAIAKPKIKGKPKISGVFQVGATLTATAQWEDGSPTWTWLSCPGAGLPSCSVIAGASGSSYVVAPADEQKRLRVQLVVRGNGDDERPSRVQRHPKIVAGPAAPPAPGPNPQPPPAAPPPPPRRRRHRRRRRQPAAGAPPPAPPPAGSPPSAPAFDFGGTAPTPPPGPTAPARRGERHHDDQPDDASVPRRADPGARDQRRRPPHGRDRPRTKASAHRRAVFARTVSASPVRYRRRLRPPTPIRARPPRRRATRDHRDAPRDTSASEP